MRGGTSVDELLTMLRNKRRRLPSEIGAFVALQTTELLLDRAYRVDPTTVFVLEDGIVAIDSEERCDDEKALGGVRKVLESLLVAAGEGVPPMMLALVERGEGSPVTLVQFRDAIEAALVPLNRGAATRVLARSLRDIRRESSGSTKSMDAADADFDALLDGRDAPDKASVHIVAPEVDPHPQARREKAGDKRSIFRDDEVAGLDEDDGESSKTMLFVALAALALAALGGVVYFTR